MAWCQTGNKPLPESMMTQFNEGICASPGHIFNSSPTSAAYVLARIGSGNGLSPVPCQAITWNNADLLSIGPLGTNFSEIWPKIQNFSFIKMYLKMSSAKWRPFCPGRDELNLWLSKVLANDRRRYICNIFSHWLRPSPAMDRKWTQAYMFEANFPDWIVRFLFLSGLLWFLDIHGLNRDKNAQCINYSTTFTSYKYCSSYSDFCSSLKDISYFWCNGESPNSQRAPIKDQPNKH